MARDRVIGDGRLLEAPDPGCDLVLARGFAFVDRWGADLHVSTMDFDASGRHLLYVVSSADPADYTLPNPPTGTWRSSGSDPPVRLHDDRRPTGREAITTANPSW